jgi:lysophospholipid acyltransferase (LPLAT)-like uncharacterized protein
MLHFKKLRKGKGRVNITAETDKGKRNQPGQKYICFSGTKNTPLIKEIKPKKD